MNISELYYQKFLALFIHEYRNELMNDHAGHCMKVTGLTMDKLKQLYPLIQALNSPVHTYILSDTETGEEYISATKLIEFRNDLTLSLLILIPVNSRTSAEDSYGDATFKELSIAPIEQKMYEELEKSIPEPYKHTIQEILTYTREYISLSDKVNYLLYLTLQSWSPEAIGNGISLLGFIPDSSLEKNKSVLRKRLACNVESSLALCDFSIPVSERVSKLPIQKGTNQRSIATFLQKEEDVKNRRELIGRLYKNYPELNFTYWEIPEIEDTKELQLRADLIPIAGKELVRNNEEDGYTLSIPTGKKVKVKLRITTQPKPKDNKDLKFFRIHMMSVDGMYSVGEVKKAKVTENSKEYRDVTFDIFDNQFDDGSYYFHVFAEDELGTVLNNNDPFRQDTVQEEWERRQQEDETLSREQFQQENRVLLTSDTETFYLKALKSDDEEAETSETRKAKIDNVLQAYFHYRIEKVRKKAPLTLPEPQQAEWLEGYQVANVFHIKYDAIHNYQIALSKKLTDIERCLLNHSGEMGFVKATVGGNPSETGLQSLRFEPLVEELMIPDELLEKRKEIFGYIKASAPENTGVVATFAIYNYIDEVKAYLTTYQEWLSTLTGVEEAQSLNAQLQLLDTVALSVEMPDGSYNNLKLLSPLHPLRLAWLVNIYDLYSDWEEQTAGYTGYEKAWFKKLDRLFYGELIPETAPLILADKAIANYYQYIGELTFGWALFVNPAKSKEDTFASSFRQIKSYLASLLNIASEKRIDSDINQELIYRHIKNYIRQHPYTDKLVINMFNAGDAAVFARTMIELEREGYELKYEVRLFADDKMILPGEALRELLNPETQVSEEAEAFSQAAENRLFPKLRFSINDLSDFVKKPYDYQAHISFLVNPFPAKTVLVRQEEKEQSFYLNGVVSRSIIQVVEKEKGYVWNRYFAENKMPNPLNEFSNNIVELFSQYQRFIAHTLAVSREQSVPATRLELTENDVVLLSLVHDVSDWVVTFDKNMGPEFYDLPCINDGDIPYLLDYIPSEDVTGISSYLTTRPTSEIEGLMLPHFKTFGIDITGTDKFKTLLEDVRSVSSSLLLQVNKSRNTAFEVLGTTFMKRMLEKKGLLEDAFLIPVDLHKGLFEHIDADTKERADTLLVNIHPQKREIVFTVVEIKCRKSLSPQEKEDLQDKINHQIENTIHALRVHFDMDFQPFDRLDRELKTMELSSLLSFYLQRAKRYNKLNLEGYEMYMNFLATLCQGYTLKFKNLGIIFDFACTIRQQKEYVGDTTFYTMGRSIIEEILDNESLLKTIDSHPVEEEELYSFFEVPERTQTIREVPTAVILETSGEEEETETPDVETPPQKEQEEVKETETPEEIKEEKQPEPKPEAKAPTSVVATDYSEPRYEITIGKSSDSQQYGILGKTFTHNRPVAIDLSETNTISLFGVQGGGKSYSIGIISEMVLKQFSHVNKLPAPLAGVIFHYSESMDYAPEFTSMIYPNDQEGQLRKLKEEYGAEPGSLDDVILLTPKDKVEERQSQYPSIEVRPISFNSSELNVQDWMFLLGAVGNDSTYIKQLKAIMKSVRNNISLRTVRRGIAASQLLNNTQKNLAEQRLQFAEEYIDDECRLRDLMKPGRLIVVDLRDEFIAEDEALGLFVVMLNIFSGVKEYDEKPFNKFIVFDEAHKYMNNKELTNSIVTAIREMRHKGVSLMIASQDPMSLPTEIIELSSIVLLHKFNSPQWVKHVQKSIIQLATLSPAEMCSLVPGEAFVWATKSTDKNITSRPVKIATRPRVTKHGGDTLKAVE